MEENQNLSKEPWLAVVLSLCWTGVGQIYAGRVSRGIILILIKVFLIFLSTWSWLIPKCDVLISIGLILVLLAVIIWNLFDAHKCARKTNSQDFETERKQNKDPWLALFLSNLIPGLGQLYLKKRLGILFIVTAGLMFIVVKKYELLYVGFWGIFGTFICFHAYKSAPVRREKSRRAMLIVCAVILCWHLSNYDQHLFKLYVVEAFRIPTPGVFNWIQPEKQWGSAMKPTLIYEDRYLVRKSKKYVPKRGDVVVFKPPDKEDNILYTMRIAAMSGETIQIRDGMLYIDDKEVQWRPIEMIEYPPNLYGVDKPYYVPENCFFVLGDNSANSRDSRIYGAIPLSDLIGKAYKIYWPLSRRGPIE